jgi:hypothetical protein
MGQKNFSEKKTPDKKSGREISGSRGSIAEGADQTRKRGT